MDLYFAGINSSDTDEFIFKHNYNKLLSYVNDKKNIRNYIELRKQGWKGKLIIDSGAFTAWTKGKKIDVDTYCSFINEVGPYVTYFGQIDVIPLPGCSSKKAKECAEATWDNYRYMINHVNCPSKLMYTYHVGEPEEMLIQALKWGSEHREIMKNIAIGGMVRKGKLTKDFTLKKAFSLIEKYYKGVGVHLFGCTSVDYFREFPATSADSSSATQMGAVGSVATPYGTFTFGKKIDKTHYDVQPKIIQQKLTEYFAQIPLTIEELKEVSTKRIVANMYTFWESFKYHQKERENDTKIKSSLLF